MSRYTAVLDACVLVPIVLTDTLLRVAERELYRPLWSERILGEAEEAVLEVHPDIDAGAIARRFAWMRATFEDSNVEGWESVDLSLVLPDPDDLHVVAAAVRGRADSIVTTNIQDFPSDVLKSLSIEAVDPDTFLLDQLDLSPRVVVEVIKEQAAHSLHPSLEPVDVLNRLARCGATNFADEVKRLI